MSSANPITRSTRRRDYDATAGQTVFTLDVPVYDLVDVEVWTKLASAVEWTQIFTGFALSFIAGNQVQATFAVAPRPTAGDPATNVRIQSARNQERVTNATRGGAVASALLEQDLDRIATVLQELRRDADEFRAGVTAAQVQQLVTGSGNVPAPTATNIGRFLRALSATTFGWVSFVSSMISDASTAGLALLTAANAAAQRTALGLASGATTTVGTSATRDIATAAEYRAKTANRAVGIAEALSAVDFVTLTDASSVIVDLSQGYNFRLTATAGVGVTRTLANPINAVPGQWGVIEFIQDSAGSRGLSFSPNYDFNNGTPPTISSAPNAVDILVYFVRSSTSIAIAPYMRAVG